MQKSVYLFAFLLILYPALLAAQASMVTGDVRGSDKEPLALANIILVDGNAVAIKFTAADKNGVFRFPLPDLQANQTYFLEVSYLGYKKQRLTLDSHTREYHFLLTPDQTQLKEVVVRNRPVLERLGDTLRYQVMSFAKPEDRSIGDVLRRMPGIDIATDGTIYYNGKKIENLYIQGDDLMDGKYGLAPKVIKKEDIESVDVIRNHQPIRVLKDKIATDNTAINLVLKDENRVAVSGKLSAGAGLPGQYDVSASAILLNKKIKMINTIAANNSGVDYSNDFKQLGSSNMIADIRNQQPEFSLGEGNPGPPDIPLVNYYLNRSGFFSLNDLYKTKGDLQFKANISGFIDRNRMSYDSRIKNFTAGDTINFHQNAAYINSPTIINTSLTITANKPKYFLNENIKINFRKDADQSAVNFNGMSFPQSLNKNAKEFSNDLDWLPTLCGKGIGELRWLISYKTDEQHLDIGQGFSTDILGQTGNYDYVKQGVNIPTLFSNAFISYKLPGQPLSHDFKVGYIFEGQQFNSNLVFQSDDQLTSYAGGPGNKLRWRRSAPYIESETQFKSDHIQASLALPLSYQDIHYSQDDIELYQDKSQLLFNPNARITYSFNPEERLSATYKYQSTLGTIGNVFRGAVLKDFQTLAANSADVQRKDNQSAALNYNFEHSISFLFINAGLSWDQTVSSTIMSSTVNNNIIQTILLPYVNTQTRLKLSGGFSKYVFGLKSTLSLKLELNRAIFPQIVNNQLLPSHSNGIDIHGTFNKKIAQVLTVNYQPDLSWNKVQFKDDGATSGYQTFRLDHHINLDFNLTRSMLVGMAARQSYTEQSDFGSRKYLFCDLIAKKSFKKKHIDLSMDVTNIFNVKDYTFYYSQTNQLLVNHYAIRGRMAILRIESYF